MNHLIRIIFSALFLLGLFGCSKSDDITLVTREEGAGTRTAFVELSGVLYNNIDRTSLEAIVHDGTGKILTCVANDPNSIGYISLGSLNDTVKPIDIDGVSPTNENIQNQTYPLARPFNIATQKNPSPIVKDFINFILSSYGSSIISQNSYTSISNTESFSSTLNSGEITIGGSTSIYPLMEKLVESYSLVNPNTKITIESMGSSAGIKGVMDGVFDIGMASRTLSNEEQLQLESLPIALDGIVIILNNINPISSLSMDNLRKIYIGEITNFSQLC